MRFEHLIEINDPSQDWLPQLTPEQLWNGLLWRIWHPEQFLDHLDHAEVRPDGDAGLARQLHFGALVIHDQVCWMAPHTLVTHVPAQGDIAAATLTVHIETPVAHALFVRFTYEDDAAPSAEDEMSCRFRQSAYLEADLDAIRRIRSLAADGRLNCPPH